MKIKAMETNRKNDKLSSELIAAYLDGNTTAEETLSVLKNIAIDEELRELIEISKAVDCELGTKESGFDILPLEALAATCGEENFCSMECEKYIMNSFGINCNEQTLYKTAIDNRWQKEEGMPLYNIGRCLEEYGMKVLRRFDCNFNDICQALKQGYGVMAVVDGGELSGNEIEEYFEDILIGEKPDHTVVVLDCDVEKGIITIFDPDSTASQNKYNIEKFADAWADSKNYLIITNINDMETYEPKPIDLTGVELPEELEELREAIAENAHEVWAVNRKAEGWSYGSKRDDEKKQNPCMIPYSQLPESEKAYDREMAVNTIKLLIKLGYEIKKR